MAMDLDCQFATALRGDERNGIPSVKPETPQPYATTRHLVEVNIADYYGPSLHRLRLSKDQARILLMLLTEYFEDEPCEQVSLPPLRVDL